MARYDKKPFRDQQVILDGNEYIDCRFERCEIIYEGGSLPKLIGNSFNECRWIFSGSAARALEFMTGLYSGGAREIIEATFENIRGKPGAGLTPLN